MKSKGIINNQKGLSLVELLVSIGLFGLIMVAAMSLMSTASRMYQKSSTEITVQNEVQTLTTHLQNLITSTNTNLAIEGSTMYLIDSNTFEVVEYDSANNYIFYYSLDQLTSDTSVISAYATIEDRDEKLAKAKEIVSSYPIGDLNLNLSSYLLAENVTEFSVTPYITDNYVAIRLTIEKNEISYSAAKNIYLRNKMYDTDATTTPTATATPSPTS